MKIVKNKDFERDDTVRRHDNPDSPLRFPMHVQWTETHEQRINWLHYENKAMLTEYLSAKLLYIIAKVRFQEKGKGTSLRGYKVAREALALWDEVNEAAEDNHLKYMESTREWLEKYHVAGNDEEWELGEEDEY